MSNGGASSPDARRACAESLRHSTSVASSMSVAGATVCLVQLKRPPRRRQPSGGVADQRGRGSTCNTVLAVRTGPYRQRCSRPEQSRRRCCRAAADRALPSSVPRTARRVRSRLPRVLRPPAPARLKVSTVCCRPVGVTAHGQRSANEECRVGPDRLACRLGDVHVAAGLATDRLDVDDIAVFVLIGRRHLAERPRHGPRAGVHDRRAKVRRPARRSGVVSRTPAGVRCLVARQRRVLAYREAENGHTVRGE